jgi:N-acetylmuramoyl-L-alanine amidase
MTVKRLLHLASALSLGLTGLFADAAIATTFSDQDVNDNRFVTVAAPFAGGTRHQLLILEQVSDRRQCWSESGSAPTLIEPLLIDFDFTGICGRSTDSNGYSVRLADDDMGWRYSLRVDRQANDLVLRAVPNDDPTDPGLEIGRTNGLTTDFAEIQLNPGWRLTRRVYNGQPLGHIYLTNERSRDVLVAEARQSSGAIATTPSRPTLPQPPTVSRPSTPSSRPTPPSTTVSIPSTPSALPTIAEAPSGQTRSYRVVVAAASPDEIARVRQVAPDAFRSVADGYTVMQAGIFQDRDRAISLQEQLVRQNLSARILRSSVDISTIRRPEPSSPSANLPIPTERALVVIDPGHGGRDPGAVGIGGLQEKDVVLNISQQVSSLLEQQGLQTLMTRQSDFELDLEPRVAAAERANADAFVSIHANALSMSRPDVNGVETFYYSTGRSLAQSIQTNLVAETGMRDRGIKQARFYVLTQTSMPSALVEVGFVTGSEDAPRLRDRAFQSRIAEAIARGILEHLR